MMIVKRSALSVFGGGLGNSLSSGIAAVVLLVVGPGFDGDFVGLSGHLGVDHFALSCWHLGVGDLLSDGLLDVFSPVFGALGVSSCSGFDDLDSSASLDDSSSGLNSFVKSLVGVVDDLSGWGDGYLSTGMYS